MKWTPEGDALVSGEFRIEVVGESSAGRPNTWGLKHRGEWVMLTVRGVSRPRTFDRRRDAQRAAAKLRIR